jgi:D-3-phosphoglycerate dehydrogenase
VSNVDLDAAESKGIVVTNTPGANSKSVAELTIALMLNLFRPIVDASTQTRRGGWPRTGGLTMEGRTIGLIGLGAIGKEVARRLAGFDCRIIATDVAPDVEFARANNVEMVALDQLLRESDIISLHLPVLPETKDMVDEAFLAKMKQGAYLVNTSRGELVDETALYNSLVDGHLAGASLDAFRKEPPGNENPLIGLPQVVPTPHMGAHTDGATNAMGRLALDDCLAVLQGKEPVNRVV